MARKSVVLLAENSVLYFTIYRKSLLLTSGLFAVTYLLLLRLSLSALSSAISSSFTPYSYSSRYDGPRSDPVRCSRRSALPLLFRVSYPNKCICRLWLNRVFNANDICNRTMSFFTKCLSDAVQFRSARQFCALRISSLYQRIFSASRFYCILTC